MREKRHTIVTKKTLDFACFDSPNGGKKRSSGKKFRCTAGLKLRWRNGEQHHG
jgi:hypothetical protein